MVRKTLLSVVALATVAMSAHTTFAAETASSPYGNRPQEIQLEDAYTLPSVFVDKLSARVRGGTLEGDFTVLSEVKDVIGNLQYRIEIYGDLPGQPTNDPQVLFAVSKTFDIAPLVSGERRVMDFSYDLPSLPEGTFTARIQVIHGGTRELGWANARIELPRTASTFLTAYGESISLPQFEGKGVGALTGPNVDPETDFSVTLGVFNAGGPETVVVPRFTVHRMDMSAPSVSETGFDPLSIPSTDSTITLKVKAPKTPGVYVGALTLEQNGKTVSTIGQYRFVVRGLDADIISARLANVASLKGETAFVRIDMVGPADAETTGKAFMQVSIRDADGIAGQVTVSDLTLNDGVGMGMAKVTLSRDLGSSPDIYVVIKDRAGNILTESTTNIGLTTAQLQAQSEVSTVKLWAAWYASPAVVFSVLLGLLFVLALAVILRKIVSLRSVPVALQHAFSGAMIVMLLVTQFSPVFAHGGSNGLEVAAPRTLAENLPFQSGDPAAYTTYWSQVWNRPIVALFINRPIHNSTVDCRQPIPLEFRVEYAACNNIPAAGRVIARFDANGNHQTTLMGTNANWIKVFEDTYVQVPDCGGARACIHTKNYNTTVNLAGLAPTATKTTLQVVVKHNAYVDASHGVPDDTISTSDVYFQRRFAQAFNLHLNCSAICGNGAVETGEQCDDGNQNPNDTCNDQCQLTRCGDGIVQNPNGNGQNEQCDDGNTNNADSCSNSCQIQAPDVEITKTSSVQSVPQGGTFNYVLVARNNGPIAAANVVVSDQIPPTLTITSVPSGCTANGNTLTCNIGTLAVNATRTFTVGVSVPANHVCPAQLNNTGVIAATGDTTPQNNQSTAQTAVTCVTTDIQITKTAPATLANDNASSFNYTLVVQNNSGTPAQNVVVNDNIPQPLTITSVPSGCTANGNALQCNVGTIAANATRTFTVGVQAPARSVCAQMVTNTANVTTTTQDTNNQNNQSSAQTNFTCQTDIRIVKTGPATMNNDAAGTFNYVLTVTNLTSTPALNVIVSDQIPAPINISAVPPGCTYNAGVVRCSLGTLAGNATVTITIPVNIGARAACGQSIPNTAVVETSTTDTNAQNNQSTISTQFTCTPPTDIEVVKTAPATLNNDAVSNFNYTITLRNLTTSTAQNVSLSDNIPQPLTITSVPAGCNANGNAINCPVGSLGANATRTFTVGVSAPARSVCSQTLTNTASATTSTIETNQNNNQSTAQTNFTCTPQTDVSITKDAPATLNNDAASPFTYTITVTNTTSTPAANVVITDNVPAQLTITSLPAGCARTNNAVTCTVGTLAGNASRQFIFGVSAASRTVCSQTLTNTANVTTTTQDTNNQNNQDSAQTAFTCTPITDIEVTKTAPGSINNDAVSPFSYTITVRNLTANAAANVVITDNVPAQLTITSLPAGCARTNNAVTCTVGTLAANASRQFVFGVSVPARAVCGQTLSNTANVTTSSPESSTQNNQDTAQTAFTCTPQTDVTITKSAPASLSNDAASPFNYTLTVTNNTSVSAANVVITDTIPQPLTVTSVPAGCNANGNTVTCSVGTLGANASRQYVIGVSAPARSVCAQTVTNTAFVSTTSLETNVNNNQASAQTSFTCTALQTDVRIVKTAPATLSNDAVSPFNYTLTVSNLTTTAAANVVITDNVPAQLTITSLPAGCARTNNAVTCTVGTLAGNASRQFVFGVSAAARTVCSQSLTNTANVTTTTPENNQNNNQSSAQTHFTCTALQTDIVVTKYAPPLLNNDTASTFDYRLTAVNATQSVAAANVVITDAIPAVFTINTLPAGCTRNANTVTCSAGTLVGNASREFVINVTAAARSICAQTVPNTASVTTSTPETNLANNQTTVQTDFRCTAPQTDISIVKTGPAIINVVDLITYRLSVTNHGPARADTILIRDVIPAGLIFQPDVSESICTQVGNAIECPLAYLGANQTRGVTVRFKAGPTFVCGGAIHNTATVTTVTPETNLANNQSSLDTQVPCPSLSIEKTAPATSTAGGTITYSFKLRNTSTTQTAQNVVASDWFFDATGRIVPPFTYVSSSLGAACSYVPADNKVTCNFGTLTPGQEVNYTLTFSIPSTQQICNQTVMNQVDAWPGADRSNAAWDKAQTVVQCPASDVTVTKTAPATLSNDTVSNFNYTISARNTTAVSAANVIITDAIPSTLSITSLPAGCTSNGNAVTCNVGTLAANASRQYVIGVSAPAGYVCSQTVTNTAYVTTTTPETNPNNNQAAAQTNFTCSPPDFSVTKLGPAVISPGEILTYLVTVTNNGPTAQTNVRVVDQIPAGLTFTTNGSTPGCVQSGNSVVCPVQTYQPGQSVSYTLKFTANQNILCNSTVINTAVVQLSSVPLVTSNQTHTAVQCTIPKLDITKSAPATIGINGTITYSFSLRNTSATQTATQVELYDFNVDAQANPLMPYFTFQSISLGSCDPVDNQGRIHCDLPNLAPSQVVNFTMTFAVPNNQNLCGLTIINQVDVWTQHDEANADWDKAQTVVQCAVTDITVTKTAPATLSNDTVSNFNYTITATNTTAVSALNVVVTDAIPATLTITSLPAGCTANGNSVTCNVGTLTANQSRQYVIGVSAAARSVCGQSVPNYAYITTTSTETNPNNNRGYAHTNFTCTTQTDVTVTKTAPTTLTNDAAAPFNYTLTATNTSTVAADNVVITDTIPQPLTVVSVPAGCSANGNTVTCSAGTLAANTSRQYVIGVSVAARALCAQSVTNYVYITTTTQETNVNNNQASAQTAFTCTQQTDISITKTAPPSLTNDAVSPFHYTLTVTNNTSVAADNVVITDTIPATLTVTSVPAGCTANGNAITCNAGTLAGNLNRQYIIGVSAAARAVCSQTITNTASVTTSTFDTNSNNNSSSAQTTFTCTQQNPRLYITKAGPATVNAGSTITYSFTLQNTSAFTATNVNVYDYFIDQNYQKLLPAPFTFVSSNGLTCQYDVADQRVECNPVDLTAQQMITFTMTFNVPTTQALCGQTVTNKGETIAGTNQQTLDSDIAATTVICQTPPDFTLVKSGPASVSPGELLTYIITATNIGTTVQNNIQMYDDVPPGLTFEPNGSTPGCTEHNAHVYCAAQTFQPGQSVSYTLKFRANQNIPCNSDIINEAELEQNGTVFKYSNQTHTAVQCTIPKLDITKSAPATIGINGTITYSFSLRNTSATQTATQVELYDFNVDAQANPLMPYFTFQSISLGSCDPVDNQGRIHCDLPNLAPSQVVNFTMTFAVPNNQNLCGLTIINQVDVWTQHDEANADWDKAQTVVQCTPTTADVSIVKSGPASVNRGSNITYSLVVSNAGPATATNVVTHDQIPAGLTFVSASGATCSQVNGSIDCTIGSLAVGAPQTILLNFTTQAPGQSCTPGSVQNVATVTAQTTDPNTTNNSSQTFTSLTCPQSLTADISVVKTGPATVVRGNQIAYTIFVSNSGPSTATGVSITDVIPSGFTYVGATGATCAVTGNQSQVGCTIGTLASGASANIVLTFITPAMPQNCTQTTATNVVSVTSVTIDPNLNNNSSSAVTTLTCPQDTSADVAVLKFGPSTVVRGNQITYTLIVANYGPGTAQGITLSDPIPQGLTFVSSSGGPCSVVGNALTCAIGSLPSGQSSPIISATFLAPTIQACTATSVINTATITATTPDSQLGNNSASATTAITCPPADTADLSIVKTGTVTAQYGAQVTYSLTVTNGGPSSVSGVLVSDTFPAGLTYVSVTGATCQLALPANSPTIGGVLSCDVGALASGAQKTIQFVFSTLTAPPQCAQSTIINNANVIENDPNVTDPNTTNNQTSASTTLTCPSSTSDLSIVKTGPATVARGNNITYTLNVTNTSTATVSNTYTVTDAVPTGLTFVPAGSSANCTLQGANVVCTGSIAPAQVIPLTLIFSVPTIANCTQSVATNTAVVAGQLVDPNTTNNTSTATTTLTCPTTTTDLSITKTGPSTVVRGSTVTYTIVATNNGPSTATNVVVTDAFSSEYTYSSASGATCAVSGNVLTCTIGTMTSGQSVTITAIFTAKTSSGTCSTATVTNTASVTSDTADSNTGNNTSSVVTTQFTCPIADISVYKTDNRSTANVLDRLRYSIIITNNTSTVANSLLVTDNVPFGLTILTVSDGGTVNGQQVRWTDISVPANSSRTLYIDTEVRNDVGNGSIIRNTVDVNGKTATDETTIYNNTYVNPPPPYYPPYNPPPPYYPPNPLPPYYPPNPPPVYYPPNPPPVIYPQTGDRAVDMFAAKIDTASVTPVTPKAAQDDNGFSAVFYATLIALLAVGSAAATRFISFGL